MRLPMKFRKEYSNEDVRNAAKEVQSMRALLKRLGLKAAGGNYANMKRKLQLLEIDCSHWTGQAWNKDQQLKDWSDYKRASKLKPHLVKERGHQCETCNLAEWLGNQIVLEIHHVDGDRTNNNPKNLRLLCPNCHSLTEFWRNKK